MKDLGKLSWFLGNEFRQDDHAIEMNQTKCVERLLTKFKMNDRKPRANPCDLDVNKLKAEISVELENPKFYREIVGSLIHLMVGTRVYTNANETH